MSAEKPFTKENLDQYLKELGKEFRKRNGNKIPEEMVLIGGASILVNYGFREMTYDIDAIINASGAMKDAINTVGDKLDLPYGWLNTDFMKTTSYTSRLLRFSKYYKTFSNILQVRTVTAEYLVAMKLMSGREYKNDLSDIIGVIIEQEERNDALSFDRIKNAIIDLYEDYENIPENSRNFIEALYKNENLSEFYRQCREMEKENREALVNFQNAYPNVLSKDNLSNVIKAAREKKNSGTSMIKAVIFDMYETLITLFESPLYFSPQMAEDAGIPLEEFKALWGPTDDNRTIGKLSTEEALSDILKARNCFDENLLNSMMEKRISSRQASFDHLHPEIIPMLKNLKAKGIKIGLISNCFSEEAKIIRESILFPYFDVVCLSYEEGIKKPDLKIYQRCLDRLNLKAEDCLYVGDGGSHELEAAREIGMHPAQAVWYLKDGTTQPTTRMQEFFNLESPLEVVEVVKKIVI